jgi:hypothetical protein
VDEPRRAASFRSFFEIAIPPFLIGLFPASAIYLGAGPNLDLYLGGLTIAMVLAPPLALAHRKRLEQLIAAASIVDGVGVVWLIAMFRSDVTFAQWIAAYVLLAACVVAATGIAVALERFMGVVFASACTIVVALAWLTWPIWLSAWIDSAGVVCAMDRLIPIHPLLALNGLLQHLGIWGEWPIMYQLTSLGQDVPYSFPSSVAVSAAFHFLLGGALILAVGRRDDRPAVDEPDRRAS